VGDLFGVGVLAADLGDANISCLAGFRKSIVAAVEVLALLVFRLASEIQCKASCGIERTLSLFCSRSFLLGSLPYKRKRRASSAFIFCAILLESGYWGYVQHLRGSVLPSEEAAKGRR
jgi:hypothetical protein